MTETEIKTNFQEVKLLIDKHSPSTLKLTILQNGIINNIIIQPQGILRVYEVLLGMRSKEHLKSGGSQLTIERFDKEVRFIPNNRFIYSVTIENFIELYKRKVKELDKLIMIDDNLTAIYKNKKIILIANQRKLYMDSNELKETLADCMSYKKDIEIDGIFLDHKTCARLYTFLDMLT
jgi:hypothetical protein